MFRPVLARLGLRYINRRFFQSLLFILGVAIGVAVVIAIDIANDSAGRAFNLSAESITGRATHRVIGNSDGVSTALYRDIRLGTGIRDSAPVIAESVRVLNLEDTSLRLLGVDPFAEPPFRDYLTTINVIGENEVDAFTALTNFIADPGTALISQSLAERNNLEAGDILELRAGANRSDVRIIGVLQPEDNVSQQALDDILLTDISTAQEVMGTPGRISRVDLILDSDAELAAVRDMLPAGTTLAETGGGDGSALAQMTEAFEINLQALSLLAVVVGVFLIYNTVSFSVVQRRPTIGIMRSLGTTKSQIFTFIVGEAFLLGLAGTILGVGLGIIFGRLMVGLVAQTITDLYFSVTVTTITVAPFTLIKGAGIGLIASTVAAVIPAYDATRTAPLGS
ncbi:MAG: ABC transporter permease, partial [Aggregatilineales bacterium]